MSLIQMATIALIQLVYTLIVHRIGYTKGWSDAVENIVIEFIEGDDEE